MPPPEPSHKRPLQYWELTGWTFDLLFSTGYEAADRLERATRLLPTPDADGQYRSFSAEADYAKKETTEEEIRRRIADVRQYLAAVEQALDRSRERRARIAAEAERLHHDNPKAFFEEALAREGDDYHLMSEKKAALNKLLARLQAALGVAQTRKWSGEKPPRDLVDIYFQSGGSTALSVRPLPPPPPPPLMPSLPPSFPPSGSVPSPPSYMQPPSIYSPEAFMGVLPPPAYGMSSIPLNPTFRISPGGLRSTRP